MDPIDIADVVLEMGAGVFAILFSAAFGVSIAPVKKSRNLPKHCVAASYEDSSIVAFVLACFAAVSVVCACIVKRIYKRPIDGNAEANSFIAWRLIYALIPLAVMTYILSFVFFVMVTQYRLGKIRCWRLVTQVFIFGACMIAVIAAIVFGMIGYRYGRDLEDEVTGGRPHYSAAAGATELEARATAEETTTADAIVEEEARDDAAADAIVEVEEEARDDDAAADAIVEVEEPAAAQVEEQARDDDAAADAIVEEEVKEAQVQAEEVKEAEAEKEDVKEAGEDKKGKSGARSSSSSSGRR